MSVFPNGYNMVPSGMNYTLQPQYQGVTYQVPVQPIQPVQQQILPMQQQQMQQPIVQQQQQPPAYLGGKMVDSVEVVRAIDIPMDGNVYYFPKADKSEIYTKRWKDDGQTELLSYKRDPEPPSQETKQVLDSIMCKDDVLQMQELLSQKLDSVLERVSKLEEAFK